MASNILSRFLPPTLGEPSVYETLRQHDEPSDHLDMEERAGMSLDEENLGAGFQDYELDDALADASQFVPARVKDLTEQSRGTASSKIDNRKRAPVSIMRANIDELDDEVPQSLLIEGDQDPVSSTKAAQKRGIPPPIPGPVDRGARSRWQTTQDQQQLYQDNMPRPTQIIPRARKGHPLAMMDPRERAMWRWANVENLDNFLKDVYDYFLGNGIWCILLSRILNLL